MLKVIMMRLFFAMLAFAGALLPVFARDLGQWGSEDKVVREWFSRQTMPDNPLVSCCGQADAYWSDQYEQTKDGQYVAIVTDDRPDEPLKRPHLAPGTRIVVPTNKLKFGTSDPNPTGHGVIFMSKSGQVYCYLPPTGS